ncbi:MAG: trigger factor [Caldilineaceae bacterium]|nr:trigger factor [Caldilineaceae bacterium]
MSIKITREEKEHRQLGLVIEVDEARFQQEMQKAARKVANQYKIPGFRKGKAPYNIILRHFGVGALVEEFVDDLGQEMYKTALEQEEIEPYGIGSMDNIEMDPLRYHVTVPLVPEVKVGDYRSLRVEEKSVEVDEAEVQARIDQILERESGYQDVTRPSEYGDLMTVDVKAVVLDADGNETDTVVLDETDWDITPDEENPMEPAGFDAALLGLTPGDEKTFEIDWPEDSPSMYAGERVRFQVKLHGTQAYATPELTDELAQSVGPDFETADDLIARIRENLQEELSGEAEDEFLDSIMEQLVEMSEIDFPPAAVEMQLDQMMQTMDYRFRQMGIQGLDAFLEMTNQTAEAYREEQREEAEKVLQRNLVLGEIAVAEKVKATDEEIEEQIGVMFGELDEDATEEQIEARKRLVEIMKEGSTRMSVVEQIVTEKTFTLLKALARGEDIPLPAGDDENDAPDADSPASEEPVAAENEDASEPTAQAADDSPAEDVVAEVEG